MTPKDAVQRLKQLDTMCPYLDANGNRVDRTPFLRAVEMATIALELQDGNLYRDDVSGNWQIGTINGNVIM